MKYRMNIAGLDRELPLCPLNDDVYIGGHSVIFGDPELTTAAAQALLERAPEYDYIITAESKGIPLAHEMARLAGNQKYFLARKAPKLYMDGVFEVTVRSITTAGEQKLYMDGRGRRADEGKARAYRGRCYLHRQKACVRLSSSWRPPARRSRARWRSSQRARLRSGAI